MSSFFLAVQKLRKVWDLFWRNERKGVSSSVHVVFISWEPSAHYFINAASIFAIQSRTKGLNSHTACLLPFPVIHEFTVCPLSVYCLSVCVKHDCFGSLRNFVEWACPSDEQDASPVLLCCTLCVHGHSYTPIPVPALVWILEFAPTNRPLNLTHIQHIQTARTTRCFPSDIVLAATECVSRHNSNRTTFESSPILRKPVGFPGANEMPARQMDMREPQSDPTLGSK